MSLSMKSRTSSILWRYVTNRPTIKGALDNPAGGKIQFLNYWNEIVKHGSN